MNLDLGNVDTVLLTHLHIDHSGDLAAFFNARALTSDGPIVYRIFGPDGAGLFPKTSRFVDLLAGKDGAFEYQKTFGARESFQVRDLAINLYSPLTKIVDENGLVVEEIATHHGDCPSVAYRISYKNEVLVFSGDMDASALPNLVQLAKNRGFTHFQLRGAGPSEFTVAALRPAYAAEENWRSRALERRGELAAEPYRARRREPRRRRPQINSCFVCRANRVRDR